MIFNYLNNTFNWGFGEHNEIISLLVIVMAFTLFKCLFAVCIGINCIIKALWYKFISSKQLEYYTKLYKLRSMVIKAIVYGFITGEIVNFLRATGHYIF